jgi:hypothetical protein
MLLEVWPHSFLSRSSALFRAILLIVLVTQFTAVLHAGSRVSCHNFLSLCLCFISQPRPDGPQLRSEIVVVLVDSLYAVGTEATKSRAALPASVQELIWILGNTKAEARLWSHSRSVNFSTGSKSSLALTLCRMQNTMGTWWVEDIRINDL